MTTLKVSYTDFPHARRVERVDGETSPNSGPWEYEVHDGDGGSIGGSGLGPARTTEAWLTDVAQVTRLGQYPRYRADHLPKLPDLAHLNLEFWCWMGDASAGDDDLLTVLMVRFHHGDDTRVLVVERAWLLGPDGQTIERVAP